MLAEWAEWAEAGAGWKHVEPGWGVAGKGMETVFAGGSRRKGLGTCVVEVGGR
jgi:hypothetical protein